MLKYIIVLLISASFLSGCFTGSSADRKISEADSLRTAQLKKEAMDHFVQGAIADAKGDVSGAILEYQDAIKLDPKPGIYYALGRDYLQLNKLSLALDNAKNAVSLDSTSSDYYSLLAEIYTNGHQPDSAAYAYEKIIQLDSTNLTAYYSLGMIYEISKPMRALDIYKKLLERLGPEWNVLARIAELNERLGNSEEAIKNLEQLLSIDPSNLELQKLLVESYGKTKRYDEALAKLNELLVQYPGDLVLTEMKGQMYLQKGDWMGASKVFELLLDNPKVSFESKVRIGSVYLAQTAADSTLLPVTKQIFTKLDKDTTSWQIKMILGEIALQEKNDSLAMDKFRSVTELAKWNADAWVRLASLYYDHKKYKETIDLILSGISSFPDNYPLNLLLGLAYTQQNDYPHAKEYLIRAVNLNPREINSLSAIGFVLNQLKEYDESVKYINQALEIDPKNADLLGTLGMIYNAQKKWPQCDSAYTEALKADPENVLLLNNYAYSLAERGIRLNEAKAMSEKAVAKEPENSSYLDTYGWVLFRMGQYDKAEEYVRKAIKIDGDNSTLLEHLGDIIFKEGNKTIAVEMWQKAYQLNSANDELKSKITRGEL